MLNALLEIGCEEIPARFMPGFLEDLKKKAEDKLRRERITYTKIRTLGTYRRLTLYIENIVPRQEDLSEEVKGPPAEKAFDASGKPTQAAVGFAKSLGVSAEALVTKEVGKKNYVFARVLRKGKPTEKVLAAVFPEIISSLYQPLAMRWGDIDFKFIRPIHWVLALCGSKVVKFDLAGIKSSNKTVGHRYAKVKSQKSIPRRGSGLMPSNVEASKVKTAELSLYKRLLLKLGVIVDQEERKALIRGKVEAVAKRAKARALVEEDLLSEVTFLVEDPAAYPGDLDPEFLKIPQEVLITSMKKNQKYFPMVDKEGKLLAKFVVVTDGCKNAKVVEGNQKVLSARLADAKFFFEEDRKLPLRMRVGDLDRIAFFEKLGTMTHKAERMSKLAEWVGRRLGLDDKAVNIVRRITELCKADLSTKMVYEFPELQGVMGREYALLSGEDPKVAQGIFEHYLPRFAEDKLPASVEGTAVALADRIDSLVGCFSVGAIPTGSEDPYGLRRAAHGIIRIMLEKKIDLLLDEGIERGYKLYEPVFLGYLFEKGETGYQDFPKIKRQILDFIAARLKPIFLERGIRYDIVDAVLCDCNDIMGCLERAAVLNRLASGDWFRGVVRSADRVSRIAKDAPRDEVIETDLAEKEEKSLFDAYMKVNWEVGEAENKREWEAALKALAKLTQPIETFFEKVLVMHENEKLKLNRLSLLKSLEKLYLRVADFRKIVVQ